MTQPPTRRQILAAASTLAVGAMIPGLLPAVSARAPGASILRGSFRFDDDSPRLRLMATGDILDRAVRFAQANPAAWQEMLAHHAAQAVDIRRRYALNPPEFSFANRSMLTDLVVGYGLAKRVRAAGGAAPDDAGLAAMRDACIACTTDLVAALRRAGNNTWQYHVGQGSNMMPLAIAYDWLHADLSPQQRRDIASAIVEYSIRPTCDAVNAPDDRPERIWWVTGFNNWSTICIGGAILGALALRRADYDEPFESFVEDGSRQTRSLEAHFDMMLPRGLERFRRGLQFIQNAGGGSDEGPGYHHDMIYPLYAVIVSLEAALRDGASAPPPVAVTIDLARRAAGDHLNTAIHMAGPSGRDFEYGDGTWPITNQPINLLIADYARQVNAPLWRAAAWQARRRNEQTSENRAVRLLYLGLFDWDAPITTDRGMAGFDPASIPLAVLMHRKVIEYDRGEVGSNEFLTVFRQSFTDADSAGVLVKGGDKRKDHHERLDTGAFVYDALGVRWSIITGRPEGYPLYFMDGVKQWKEVTSYQSYPKRACSQNTLVINPAINDYTLRKVKRDWLWQVNPDQAMDDGTSFAVSPVDRFDADSSLRVFSASVNLAGAYERFGVRTKARGASDDPRRTFTFDRDSGALTIRDAIEFVPGRHDNELWWFMHVAPTTEARLVEDRRVVLSAPRADGRVAFLEILLDAGTEGAAFRFGPIDRELPAGQPADQWLWGYGNAAAQRKTGRKLSIHLPGLTDRADLTVTLHPRAEWTGRPPAGLTRPTG